MLQTQHDLRNDIATDLEGGTPAKRADAVTLVGYLRHDAADARLRLYRDPAVDVFVAIRIEDVVDTSAVDAAGQSMIWVRHDATLVWHESLSASTFAPPAGGDDETGEGGKWPRP
jgi:hypothetical protein